MYRLGYYSIRRVQKSQKKKKPSKMPILFSVFSVLLLEESPCIQKISHYKCIHTQITNTCSCRYLHRRSRERYGFNRRFHRAVTMRVQCLPVVSRTLCKRV